MNLTILLKALVNIKIMKVTHYNNKKMINKFKQKLDVKKRSKLLINLKA